MEQFIGVALRMESEGEPCIVPTMTPKKGEEETADKVRLANEGGDELMGLKTRV